MGNIPLHTNSAFVLAKFGNTNPGQSHRITPVSPVERRWMVWKCLVFPGVEDTETRFSPRREFIVEDLPTLG